MLSKEQIKEIQDDKRLFFFVLELLKKKRENGEVEVTAVFKNGKFIKKKVTTIG